MNAQNEVSTYLENISILLVGVLFLAFPLVFLTLTTDSYVLPKQVFLGAIVLLVLLLSGAKMLSDKTVRMIKTPFDLPVVIFAVVIVISSLLAVNRMDSFIALVPLLLSIIAFYLVVNVSRNASSAIFLLACFLTGATLLAAAAVFSYFKVYVLPFPFAKVQYFTLFGALLDQAMYLAFALPATGIMAWKGLTSGTQRRSEHSESMTANLTGAFLASVGFIVILFGFLVTAYQLATTQRPLLLPFETGFQVSFAAISQDAGRIAQGFLFGSGYGTFYADFMRFRQAAFNLNQNLWSFTFFRSSSFVLELLATTGILGLLSFGYLMFQSVREVRASYTERKKAQSNPLSITVMLSLVAAILLPFSPILTSVFFLLLGLFAVCERLIEGTNAEERYYDVELHFVAFKKSVIPLVATPVVEGQSDHKRYSATEQSLTRFLPVSIFLLFVLFSALMGLQLYQYTASDITFQHSFVAASQNNGLQTYTDQGAAVRMFQYRDAYYRIIAQTDLALANALAASVQPGKTPSAQIQQNVTALIQESITAARRATEISPQNSINWQNLSSIYRSLIGFGQNAEQFAILTEQQAIALNPSDPQGYVNLGGIYYQLKLWDQAQQQFQLAINLKPDYANAYYNLAHALEEKGDYQNAILAYQTTKSLVVNDPVNQKKVDQDIENVKNKAGQAAAQTQEQAKTNLAPEQNPQPLQVNQPQTQLPQQQNQVKIPPPQAPTVTPTGTQTTPSPTPAK